MYKNTTFPKKRNKMIYTRRQKFNSWIKAVAVIVVIAFSMQNVAFAGEISTTTLSPELFASTPAAHLPFEVSLLCEAIEKQARETGELDIEDIKKWLASKGREGEFQSLRFQDQGDEIHILAQDKYLLRYAKGTSLSPLFKNAAKAEEVLDHTQVTPNITRQILRTELLLPRSKESLDVFNHIRAKAGLEEDVDIKSAAFANGTLLETHLEEMGFSTTEAQHILGILARHGYIELSNQLKGGHITNKFRAVSAKQFFNEMNESLDHRAKAVYERLEKRKDSKYRICRLYVRGSLEVHPEFEQDYEDMQKSGIGFPYVFKDGVTRWIDLAEAVAYRAAMHEFNLPGRKGLGHAHLNNFGKFDVSRKEKPANYVGRRYSLVDDAMWLWYLHSYKMSDATRYDNKMFKTRLNWLFYSNERGAKILRDEFPALAEDAGRREEAIKLALLINEKFFHERERWGIDTRPKYEKDPINYSELLVEKEANTPLEESGPREDKESRRGWGQRKPSWWRFATGDADKDLGAGAEDNIDKATSEKNRKKENEKSFEAQAFRLEKEMSAEQEVLKPEDMPYINEEKVTEENERPSTPGLSTRKKIERKVPVGLFTLAGLVLSALSMGALFPIAGLFTDITFLARWAAKKNKARKERMAEVIDKLEATVETKNFKVSVKLPGLTAEKKENIAYGAAEIFSRLVGVSGLRNTFFAIDLGTGAGLSDGVIWDIHGRVLMFISSIKNSKREYDVASLLFEKDGFMMLREPHGEEIDDALDEKKVASSMAHEIAHIVMDEKLFYRFLLFVAKFLPPVNRVIEYHADALASQWLLKIGMDNIVEVLDESLQGINTIEASGKHFNYFPKVIQRLPVFLQRVYADLWITHPSADNRVKYVKRFLDRRGEESSPDQKLESFKELGEIWRKKEEKTLETYDATRDVDKDLAPGNAPEAQVEVSAEDLQGAGRKEQGTTDDGPQKKAQGTRHKAQETTDHGSRKTDHSSQIDDIAVDATGGMDIVGPYSPGYRETGSIIRSSIKTFVDDEENLEHISKLAKSGDKVLLRIPVKALEAIGADNAKRFLGAFKHAENMFVELYGADLKNDTYEKFGIEKRDFTAQPSRSNTVTLFAAKPDENLSYTDIVERISDSFSIMPEETLLMPVGLDAESGDLSGLIRGTLLGLRLISIAKGEADEEFIRDTLKDFQTLCMKTTPEDFDLTEEDLIGLATGNINKVVTSLNKLLKLLPMTPINPEVLREMYEHAALALSAA